MWHIRFPTCVACSALFYIVQVVYRLGLIIKVSQWQTVFFVTSSAVKLLRFCIQRGKKDMFGTFTSPKDFMIKDL